MPKCGDVRYTHRTHIVRNFSAGKSWGRLVWRVRAKCGAKANLPRGKNDRRPPDTFTKW